MTSHIPHPARMTNAILPKNDINGFLTTLTVRFGEIKRRIFKIMCPKKTPMENPKTFTMLKTGTYPAKSSSPKIKGMEKAVTKSPSHPLVFFVSEESWGIIYLSIGWVKRLKVWRLFLKLCANVVNIPSSFPFT